MLPYENASTGKRAIDDIQKILSKFGCSRFGTMMDIENGEVIIQFSYKGRDITAKASFRGYAAAWLKEHPYKDRMRCSKQDHESKAMEQARISVYSILRDWIKGQITAIETGILSFEGAFLGQIQLPSGMTILEQIKKEKTFPLIEDKTNA